MTKEREFDLQDRLVDHTIRLRVVLAISIIVTSLLCVEIRTHDDSLASFGKPGVEKGLRVFGLLGPVRLQFADIVLLSKG